MAHDPLIEPLRNRLLARLEPNDYARLLPSLQLVPLEYNQPIYEVGGEIEYAYFPTRGVVSAVAATSDGASIEVATIGNEGMTGLPAVIEPETSPNRLYVQVAGQAARIPAETLRREGQNEGPLRKLLQRYQNAFMAQVSQAVACNGLHTIQQRCCRWLLITHDRIQDKALPLTHELLAIMLGVRRPGVTIVLQNLQSRGVLEYTRGKIEVRDRQGLEESACECYRIVHTHYERLLGPDNRPPQFRGLGEMT